MAQGPATATAMLDAAIAAKDKVLEDAPEGTEPLPSPEVYVLRGGNSSGEAGDAAAQPAIQLQSKPDGPPAEPSHAMNQGDFFIAVGRLQVGCTWLLSPWGWVRADLLILKSLDADLGCADGQLAKLVEYIDTTAGSEAGLEEVCEVAQLVIGMNAYEASLVPRMAPVIFAYSRGLEWLHKAVQRFRFRSDLQRLCQKLCGAFFECLGDPTGYLSASTTRAIELAVCPPPPHAVDSQMHTEAHEIACRLQEMRTHRVLRDAAISELKPEPGVLTRGRAGARAVAKEVRDARRDYAKHRTEREARMGVVVPAARGQEYTLVYLHGMTEGGDDHAAFAMDLATFLKGKAKVVCPTGPVFKEWQSPPWEVFTGEYAAWCVFTTRNTGTDRREEVDPHTLDKGRDRVVEILKREKNLLPEGRRSWRNIILCGCGQGGSVALDVAATAVDPDTGAPLRTQLAGVLSVQGPPLHLSWDPQRVVGVGTQNSAPVRVIAGEKDHIVHPSVMREAAHLFRGVLPLFQMIGPIAGLGREAGISLKGKAKLKTAAKPIKDFLKEVKPV
eukprot:TRINITY_DN10637_c0_g1_i1.p1 TRINITY_DN10637_c0_g1~~TRINITY_DN10637_c0_g1_i1.p1  ORF type:complete len:587 (+),score=141.39 TRINITY_DN10637_c0_g1_i1:92-1762(+)